MAVYTQHRIKIRLAFQYVFALLDRLHPRVSAARVFRTVEALENYAATFALLTCVLLVVFGCPFWTVFVAVPVVHLLLLGPRRAGWLLKFPFRLLLPFSALHAALCSGVLAFVSLAVFLGVACACGCLVHAVCYVVASFLSLLVTGLLERPLVVDAYFRTCGKPFTFSELSFWQAFAYWARRIGVNPSPWAEFDEVNNLGVIAQYSDSLIGFIESNRKAAGWMAPGGDNHTLLPGMTLAGAQLCYPLFDPGYPIQRREPARPITI